MVCGSLSLTHALTEADRTELRYEYRTACSDRYREHDRDMYGTVISTVPHGRTGINATRSE
jgi:hypothetical protein